MALHTRLSDSPTPSRRRETPRRDATTRSGGPASLGLAATAAALALGLWRATRPAFDLRGRVVLITGGSRGLGFQLAREFGRRGARLVLMARSEDDLAEATARVRDEGVPVLAVRGDVRDPREVRAGVAKAVAWSGRLDVLVNNAGIITVAPLENAQTDDYEQSLATHFWGPYHCVQACLPHLRRVSAGRIVNVASIGGRIGVPHLAAYSAGKFALVGWSEVLRASLHAEGIRVTTATPGLMRTGSHVRAVLRGDHTREARWFGAGVVTPFTSMAADRAARQIVGACVAGRAHVTPGVQARMAEMASGLSPGTVAAVAAAANTWLLPRGSAAPGREVARLAGEVGFGWLAPLLPRDPIDAEPAR